MRWSRLLVAALALLPCASAFVSALGHLVRARSVRPLARAVAKAFGQSDVRAMEHNVSNCALYWHYLLGVWLVVFGLLFSGNNFEILLRICGFI